MYSQLGGTFPAPLFLFLAGISFALVTDKLIQRGTPPSQIARSTIRRGAEIFGFGLLFRLQEYLISWGWAPKSDLLRVDILNTIGLSMMLMGVMCWLVLSWNMWGQPLAAVRPGAARMQSLQEPGLREQSEPKGREAPREFALIVTAVATALAIALVTPMLWTSWRPRWLPWPLESYINGVHNLNQPQAWLFPLFPWAGFAFAGLAVGFVLVSDWVGVRQAHSFALLGAAGFLLILFARWWDAQPQHLYAVYDFWHTSPNFFLIRVGLLLLILLVSYAWCRWGFGSRGFSPLLQLGETSLLVYWVHMEFVYGRFSILTKRAVTIRTASAGLLAIFGSMLLLSVLRTQAKRSGPEFWLWLRRPLKAA